MEKRNKFLVNFEIFLIRLIKKESLESFKEAIPFPIKFSLVGAN